MTGQIKFTLRHSQKAYQSLAKGESVHMLSPATLRSFIHDAMFKMFDDAIETLSSAPVLKKLEPRDVFDLFVAARNINLEKTQTVLLMHAETIINKIGPQAAEMLYDASSDLWSKYSNVSRHVPPHADHVILAAG